MSIPGDFRRLRHNGAASAAELAEFLQQMRGKRPQEVLGLVAQSSLTKGVAASSLFTLLLLGLLTVVPYAWGKVFPGERAKATVVSPQSAAEPTQSEPATPAATAAAAQQPAAPLVDGPPTVQPSEDILEKLGVGEAKASDPTKNPLESKTDDLLKDLK